LESRSSCSGSRPCPGRERTDRHGWHPAPASRSSPRWASASISWGSTPAPTRARPGPSWPRG
jgi:hypothetical protein